MLKRSSSALSTAKITILALAGISFILTRYGGFCFMEIVEYATNQYSTGSYKPGARTGDAGWHLQNHILPQT
ncbi:hypothetical protein H0Q29_000855 [Salmonella enterica]|nr:hypothetical protein [Salmonella enterica]